MPRDASLRSSGPSGGCDKGENRYMKVWIDQDLCTGDGLCEEIAPAVFTLLDDGLAYVKEDGDVKNEPGRLGRDGGGARRLEEAVVEASEECPGECIFIERDYARPPQGASAPPSSARSSSSVIPSASRAGSRIVPFPFRARDGGPRSRRRCRPASRRRTRRASTTPRLSRRRPTR